MPDPRKPATLPDYLDGMRGAMTAKQLEAAIRAPFDHPYRGPTWRRIKTVIVEEGCRICDHHPQGAFVPRLGSRHRLTVCGETYHVGYGGNSTGVRYCWTYAQNWAESRLRATGFSMRAAHAVWDWAFSYPHRALQNVEAALAGKLPDPRFHRLLPHKLYPHSRPVRVDRVAESEHRAHRPCKCGGWLWDWGAGWNGYATFVNWHCDRCPRVYTEYVTRERFSGIRSAPRRSSLANAPTAQKESENAT
jgi:hypothetical protein